MGYALGIWCWHKAKNLRAIPILFLLTFVAQIFMNYWAKEFRTNAPIAHIFAPIQLVVLMVFFKQNIKEPWEKKAIFYLTCGMLLFSIINLLFLQNIKVFPSNFLIISNLLQIIISVNLIFQKLDSVSTKENIFKEPIFLTALAIFIFNLFSFFIFLLNNYLLDNNIGNRGTSAVLLIVALLYYSLLLVALIFSLKITLNTRAKI